MRMLRGLCVSGTRHQWSAAGRRGRRGRRVVQTVDITAVERVTTRHHNITDGSVKAPTSTPATVPEHCAEVHQRH